MSLSSIQHLLIDFGEVKLEKSIGKGSFGVVWRGLYRGQVVAAKQMAPEEGANFNNKEADKYTEREILMLGSVQHPNVVKFIGAAFHNKTYYLLTEFIDGGDLHALMEDHDVPWPQRLIIAIDAAIPLAHLHSQRMIHRDVKTENYLMTSKWRAKMCDFGFSRHLDLSKQMTMCGTDWTLAPEIMFCIPYDEKVDVFSYGMVLCELISREHSSTFERVIPGFGIASSEIYDRANGGCPEPLIQLTVDCVEDEPSKRPSMEAVVERLKRLYFDFVGSEYEPLTSEPVSAPAAAAAAATVEVCTPPLTPPSSSSITVIEVPTTLVAEPAIPPAVEPAAPVAPVALNAAAAAASEPASPARPSNEVTPSVPHSPPSSGPEAPDSPRAPILVKPDESIALDDALDEAIGVLDVSMIEREQASRRLPGSARASPAGSRLFEISHRRTASRENSFGLSTSPVPSSPHPNELVPPEPGSAFVASHTTVEPELAPAVEPAQLPSPAASPVSPASVPVKSPPSARHPSAIVMPARAPDAVVAASSSAAAAPAPTVPAPAATRPVHVGTPQPNSSIRSPSFRSLATAVGDSAAASSVHPSNLAAAGDAAEAPGVSVTESGVIFPSVKDRRNSFYSAAQSSFSSPTPQKPAPTTPSKRLSMVFNPQQAATSTTPATQQPVEEFTPTAGSVRQAVSSWRASSTSNTPSAASPTVSGSRTTASWRANSIASTTPSTPTGGAAAARASWRASPSVSNASAISKPAAPEAPVAEAPESPVESVRSRAASWVNSTNVPRASPSRPNGPNGSAALRAANAINAAAAAPSAPAATSTSAPQVSSPSASTTPKTSTPAATPAASVATPAASSPATSTFTPIKRKDELYDAAERDILSALDDFDRLIPNKSAQVTATVAAPAAAAAAAPSIKATAAANPSLGRQWSVQSATQAAAAAANTPNRPAGLITSSYVSPHARAAGSPLPSSPSPATSSTQLHKPVQPAAATSVPSTPVGTPSAPAFPTPKSPAAAPAGDTSASASTEADDVVPELSATAMAAFTALESRSGSSLSRTPSSSGTGVSVKQSLSRSSSNMDSADKPSAQIRGQCGGCGKDITMAERALSAAGRKWHHDHFVCAHCQKPLGKTPFFELNGKVYCSEDYESLFLPRCHVCQKPQAGNYVSALGKIWCPEHLTCGVCKQVLSSFVEHNGQPLCQKHYEERNQRICKLCTLPISSGALTTGQAYYHRQCLVCKVCSTALDSQPHFVVDGAILCQEHYAKRSGSLTCHGCQKPLVDTYVDAMEKRWHPTCLVCTTCRLPFEGGYYPHAGMPYCKKDFFRLKNLLCGSCDTPITDVYEEVNGKRLHVTCAAKLK
ncbi:hypothetical protein CAOG_08582 [Capsaspora owczarzaki ATCC 30864]|uniref:TKL/LISK/LISK-DD1 protein kinase n=1 Tax=Capsaspora owczarzaki (strain ATCC 30864) TaxID=595528 RepID=A0A0D2WKN0_CAPO3|nr:hypothetical protein CAOG_08582 [Capsaspora owczarzaki ATCC 30864]KJE90875.1 TKL/LISK/LISK-DD1 protein kinase [Capsaspora owczarzaki ATCC 30864]|eukprot:XP_011270182.1 hypothetical protein CAOG_08582 [Capsaspora owczarzaki ATCC 30864]